jgi:hypothetical protein
MFPEQFAEQWIKRCTRPGETVLDPFCGRGTAPFQAVLMNRNAIGNDVNPVAFVLTGAKVDSPTQKSVENRLGELERRYRVEDLKAESMELPPFFERAFHQDTLRQILYLRKSLGWKVSKVDRFIAALALGSLHGETTKIGSYFSNQMPRTISTKPAYSLRFWRERGLWPKRIDVFSLLHQKAAFRFESPQPVRRGKAYLSDVRALPRIASKAEASVDCVITSPPYLDVTNFEEDQWLRLWFLGGAAKPRTNVYSRDNRYNNSSQYWSFLHEAWNALRPLLARRSTFICRIGGRNIVPESIKKMLSESMNFLADRWQLQDYTVSSLVRRQTDAFRPGSVGCRFEMDFCFDLYQ